jgi:hypothetical protein
MLARLCFSVLVALPAFALASSGQAVQVQQPSPGHYELTATFDGSTDVETAQRLLAPEAARRCGKQPYSLGHYTFSTSAPVAPANSEATPQITIVQQVICGASGSADPTRPQQNDDWHPGPADQEIIRKRTLAYLEAKDRGDFNSALAMVAEPTRGMMAHSQWQDARRTFNAAAGPVSSREVIAISWYDHPPGAPPGWYATADYTATYASAAFYCGYLAWMRQPDGSFTMIREDEGKLSPSEAATIPPDRMAAVRAQLGCKR